LLAICQVLSGFDIWRHVFRVACADNRERDAEPDMVNGNRHASMPELNKVLKLLKFK
jgi:hypothetical protein